MKRRCLGTFLFLAALAAIPAEAQFSLTRDDPCWEFLQQHLINGVEFGAGGLPNWDSIDELSSAAAYTSARLDSHHANIAAYGRDLVDNPGEKPPPPVLQFLAQYRDCLPTMQQFLRELSSRLIGLNVPGLIIEGDPVPLSPRRWESDAQKKALEIIDKINALRKRRQRP